MGWEGRGGEGIGLGHFDPSEIDDDLRVEAFPEKVIFAGKKLKIFLSCERPHPPNICFARIPFLDALVYSIHFS